MSKIKSLLYTYTPRACPKTHLLTAAIIWSLVGTGLILKAMSWSSSPLSAGLGVVLGLIKAKYIFISQAQKITANCLRSSESRCLGGVFQIKNWILILSMIILGRIISSLALNPFIKSLIYYTVGTGLLYASSKIWLAWKKI